MGTCPWTHIHRGHWLGPGLTGPHSAPCSSVMAPPIGQGVSGSRRHVTRSLGHSACPDLRVLDPLLLPGLQASSQGPSSQGRAKPPAHALLGLLVEREGARESWDCAVGGGGVPGRGHSPRPSAEYQKEGESYIDPGRRKM